MPACWGSGLAACGMGRHLRHAKSAGAGRRRRPAAATALLQLLLLVGCSGAIRLPAERLRGLRGASPSPASSPAAHASGSKAKGGKGPAGTRPPAATATTPSAGAAGAADAVGDASGGYLFPVLAYGPSNQVSGFKEAMALAKLLGRTLVVHDLAAHWRENTRAQIPMQQVFDMGKLAQYERVAPLAGLFNASGPGGSRAWDGKLDALLQFGTKRVSQLYRLSTYNVTLPPKAPHIDGGDKFKCSEQDLASLRASLAPYKWVGALLYDSLVPDVSHATEWEPHSGNPCRDAFFEASASLVKSHTMDDIADTFTSGAFAGEPYLAIHVRPQPDTCLQLWINHTDGRLPPGAALAATCWNLGLYTHMGRRTRELMQQHGLRHVFVAAHPEIRPAVSAILRRSGVEPTYYDVEMLVGELRQLRERGGRALGAGERAQQGEGGEEAAGGAAGEGTVADAAASDRSGSGSAVGVGSVLSVRGAAGGSGAVAKPAVPLEALPTAVSLTAMVEQDICGHAAVFVGTRSSSITGVIVQERLARGSDPAHTLTFPQS